VCPLAMGSFVWCSMIFGLERIDVGEAEPQ